VIVLASTSKARAALLQGAGLEIKREAAGIDETEIKASFRRKGAEPGVCAMALAEAKALAVSARHAEALVIGADQLLALDTLWFDKPRDRAEARAQLKSLSGRTHELATAVCVARGATVMWHDLQRPRLTMRDLGDAFIDRYVAGLTRDDLAAVGAYRLESSGIQLFERIDGDYFAILGLPLLPLLEFLRRQGELPG
jgi:septum formation protein